jgi:predicted SnoaL-like aldol condensation-catalyzing enzyme
VAKENDVTAPGQTASNKEIVRRLYGYIQDNRTTEFASVVSAKHTDHSNGRNGPSGFVSAAENLHKAYSNFEIELAAVIADGDLVAVQWRERGGVHTGPFFNLMPPHKPFEATEHVSHR